MFYIINVLYGAILGIGSRTTLRPIILQRRNRVHLGQVVFDVSIDSHLFCLLHELPERPALLLEYLRQVILEMNEVQLTLLLFSAEGLRVQQIATPANG